ncbi:hypothetical protein FDB64_10865 [Clostridium botulinum]|uniref:hypothetical protein n=1 Tax=Clostridium botulinum TaxID=1491 RepID=UPI0013F021F4|nr:hypothetical protein [Clostridium botulinum]MBN1042388.1 hypothetical protein [Clostridium botulinum]NFL35563.1 hypothetical protein [Clostridium botulinum]NFM02513.1 hypothetical protein [Clostridium botulinum]
MDQETLKQIIQETVRKSTLVNALIPVVITLIINTGYDLIRRKSESKKKYAMDQLQNLYLRLYSYIAQSEYIRYFFSDIDSRKDFNEYPFFELQYNRKTQKYSKAGIEIKEEKIETDITKINKKYIVQTILDNSQFASAKLLKLAAGYRFLEDNYLDCESYKDTFSKEEIKVLAIIIKEIVFETNKCLKYCGFDYDKDELKMKIISEHSWDIKDE